MKDSYPEPERLLENHLQETLLSYRTNRVIFKRMNLLASEQAWRRSVQFWMRLSRFKLDQQVVDDYHQESIDRTIDVLSAGQASNVLHEAPNGNVALGYAKMQRKQLQQLKWGRISDLHVINEATAGHAPKPIKRALTGSTSPEPKSE